MRCPSCNCATPLADRCYWCAKPLLAVIREPTPEEARELSKGIGRTKRKSGAQHRTRGIDHEIIRDIDDYCRVRRMSRSRFGRLSVHNPDIYRQLCEGKAVTPETRKRIVTFMESSRERA
jgi:hypothetical protein